ncbi:hypothetical protein HPB48_010224 [Haemaphysalis longicornis]|uniref:Uncharacterized protein n=1 Tax=Haemaphysalis longicornis TaxID=44386 RepID=A0A9J6GBI1_HAELO|nr:hypothetical protein HPB48_010224 [Haemaphysalis longicornis]
MCLFFLSTASASLISAFWHGWQLTLVLLALVPCLIIITTAIAKVKASGFAVFCLSATRLASLGCTLYQHRAIVRCSVCALGRKAQQRSLHSL